MPRSFESLTPFTPGWWAFDLGKYRPCDSTYCLYPYESLPPLGPVDETLSWLGPLAETTDQQMGIHRNEPSARGSLAAVVTSAAALGLTLPESFSRLMASPELQDRIPSCTACTFGLSDGLVPCFGSEEGYVVRFLDDQQGVLTWYLYLTPQGEQCILVAPTRLEELADPEGRDWAEKNRQAILARTNVCAPSFAAFLARWWLENTIWFKLDGGTALTAEEQRYLTHYSANRPSQESGQ